MTLTEETLLAYARGELGRSARARVDAALDRDPRWLGAVAGLLRDPLPHRLGRYELREELGRGGMGIVYAAYDPDLGRTLAVKALFGARRAELESEARALARLHDPRVVQVYDVGIEGDTVFVAMERVRGQTLQRWLAESSRSWREIVEVFVEAGEGLCAVHAANLVHRDFKPSNVMLADDGRVVLLDFGLASLISAPPRPGGTPLFAAPEQLRGEDPTPAADQFAFCTALHYALHGRFFAVRGHPTDSTCAPQKAPATGRWPRALDRLLAGGLAVDPLERHRSMRVVTDALRRLGRPLRTRLRALTIVVVGGAIGIVTCDGAGSTCDAGAAAAVWNEDRASQIRDRLEGLPTSWGASTAATVADGVDAWVEAWAAEYRDLCTAGAHRERRCLQSLLLELDGVLGEVERGGVEEASHAATAIANLRPPQTCIDLAPAREEPAPAVATLVRAAAAARDLERHAVALDLSHQALEEARALDDEASFAHAHLAVAVSALMLDDVDVAEGQLWAAMKAASRSGQDDVTGEAWQRLAWIVGLRRHQPDRAQDLLDQARAWSERLGRPYPLEYRLRVTEASLDDEAGEFASAQARFTEAIELARQHDAVDAVAQALYGRARNAWRSGAQADAEADLLRAIEVLSAERGADHPATAKATQTYGMFLLLTGRPAEALPYHELEQRSLVASFGEDHPRVVRSQVALAQLNLDLGHPDTARDWLVAATRGAGDDPPSELHALRGRMLTRDGDLDGAREAYLAAAAKIQLESGPGSYREATIQSNLGEVAALAADDEAAIFHRTRAVEIIEAAAGPTHPGTLTNRIELSVLRGDMGEAERAIQELDAIADASESAVPEVAGHALLHRAELTLEVGRPQEADRVIARASALYGDAPSIPIEAAEWARAKAYVAQANDREAEARSLMVDAVSRFETLGEHGLAVELRAWIDDVVGPTPRLERPRRRPSKDPSP